jgi:hypothetical protein
MRKETPQYFEQMHQNTEGVFQKPINQENLSLQKITIAIHNRLCSIFHILCHEHQ